MAGNLGLEDVRVALGWVQQNIGDFGLFSFLEFSFPILFSRRRPKKGYVGRSWTRSDYRPPSCSQPHNIRSPGFFRFPSSHPEFPFRPLQQDDPFKWKRVVRGEPQLSNPLVLLLLLFELTLLLLLLLLLNLNKVRQFCSPHPLNNSNDTTTTSVLWMFWYLIDDINDVHWDIINIYQHHHSGVTASVLHLQESPCCHQMLQVSWCLFVIVIVIVNVNVCCCCCILMLMQNWWELIF